MGAKDNFLFLYGEQFWYSALDLATLLGRGDDLYKPTPSGQKSAIWHIVHVLHKEDIHIGEFLQRPRRERSHRHLDRLAMSGEGLESVRDLIPDPRELAGWQKQTRRETIEFIAGLAESDFDEVPDGSPMGLSIANWLAITQVHAGVHLGQINAILAEVGSQ
jgi:hypothetical protein